MTQEIQYLGMKIACDRAKTVAHAKKSMKGFMMFLKKKILTHQLRGHGPHFQLLLPITDGILLDPPIRGGRYHSERDI